MLMFYRGAPSFQAIHVWLSCARQDDGSSEEQRELSITDVRDLASFFESIVLSLNQSYQYNDHRLLFDILGEGSDGRLLPSSCGSVCS